MVLRRTGPEPDSRSYLQPVQPLVGSDSILFAQRQCRCPTEGCPDIIEMINQRIICARRQYRCPRLSDGVVYIAIQPNCCHVLNWLSAFSFQSRRPSTEGIQPVVGDGSYHVARVFRHHCPIDGMAFQLLITICMPGRMPESYKDTHRCYGSANNIPPG